MATETEKLQTRICPNCHCERTWPADQTAHCMSDAEWDEYIDSLIAADKAAGVDMGDPLEAWLF